MNRDPGTREPPIQNSRINHSILAPQQLLLYDWHVNTVMTKGTVNQKLIFVPHTVYPKKYAHGFCFAVLCCGYTLTDFPISIRITSLALWQSNDCPSASKATLMNMDKYFMWIHYERLHNHNKAKHNKTVCIFLGMYCISSQYIKKKCLTSLRCGKPYLWKRNGRFEWVWSFKAQTLSYR